MPFIDLLLTSLAFLLFALLVVIALFPDVLPRLIGKILHRDVLVSEKGFTSISENMTLDEELIEYSTRNVK